MCVCVCVCVKIIPSWLRASLSRFHQTALQDRSGPVFFLRTFFLRYQFEELANYTLYNLGFFTPTAI